MGDVHGGIGRLHGLLRDHRGALEADLLAMGVDLLDLHRPAVGGWAKLSWRRLAVLVRHLPRTSAVRRAEAGGVEPFGALELLMDEHRRDFVQANTQSHERPAAMFGSPFAPHPETVASARAARQAEYEALEAADAARIERLKARAREETA